MSRTKLVERLFPSYAKIESRWQEQRAKKGQIAAELVSRPGFKVLLKDWLEVEIEKNQVQPLGHEAVLHQIGKLEGLRALKKRLKVLEDEARRYAND